MGDHGILALPGTLRLHAGRVDPIPVAVANPLFPSETPADSQAHARLRFEPTMTWIGYGWPMFQAVQLRLDGDVTVHSWPPADPDVLAHDPVAQARTATAHLRLMEASLLAAGKHVALRAGLVRSSWGTGLLANDGAEPDATAGSSPFGVALQADRVARIQVAYHALPARRGATGVPTGRPSLTLALAGDMVVDDDTARWQDGDRAYHVIGAVRGSVGGVEGGLYAVHRIQAHGQGGDSRLSVVDGHLKIVHDGRRLRGWLEGELAAIHGSTTYVESALHEGAFDVASTGGVLRFGVESGPLEIAVEAGMASGDDNPFDGQIRSFTFDRSYRVGLLMFREGMRQTSAATAINLADPGHRASPPRGFERVATGGAVRGAIYINPRLAYRPYPGLTLQLGYLHGQSEEDATDAFQSGLAGGASVGPLGAPGTRDLGDEIDVGLEVRRRWAGIDLLGRLEAGWWRPGSVFATPSGEDPAPVFGSWLRMGASW